MQRGGRAAACAFAALLNALSSYCLVLQLSALTSLSVLVSNGGCARLRASTALFGGSLVGCCYARLPHFGSICPIIGHCPPSCLQELHVSSCQPGGFAVLTSLGRLARLTLEYNSHMPACLPQLTGLEELCLHEASRSLSSDQALASVNEALQQLTGVSVGGWVGVAAALHCCIAAGLLDFLWWCTAKFARTFSYPCCLQLTSLCMLDEPERCQPQAALAGLSRLQRCCLGSAMYDAGDWDLELETLPPGPWAASLRELGASLDVLPHSLAMLSAATQLTRLAVTGGSYEDSDALWKWARSHPSLLQLQIDIQHGVELSTCALHAICSLACQRPELTVVTKTPGEPPLFDNEFYIEI